jgi:hypothetical protein
VSETLSQLRPNDVPSMAQVLKNFNPDNTSFFNGLDKGGSPNVLSGTESPQRKHHK